MNVTFISKAGIISLATLVFLLPSCSQDSLESITAQEEVPNEEDVITAVFPVTRFIDEDGTRTTYSDAETDNFAWEEGDEIVVFYNIGKSTAQYGSNPKYDRATATLTPLSGRENIANISGLSASAVDSGYPCVAYFAPFPDENPILGNKDGSDYISFGCQYSGDIWSDYELHIDISSNPKSNHSELPMIAVYNYSDKVFNFAHKSVALLRFTCNNVPQQTNCIRVFADTTPWTLNNYFHVLTRGWMATYFFYSGSKIGSYATGIGESNYWDFVEFNLFADNTSGGLPTNDSGIILNLPVLAAEDESWSYGNFIVKSYSASKQELAAQTVPYTAAVLPGYGFHYTVNFE